MDGEFGSDQMMAKSFNRARKLKTTLPIFKILTFLNQDFSNVNLDVTFHSSIYFGLVI